MFSDVDHFCLSKDFLDREKLTFSCSWADLRRVFPITFGVDVAIPERPSPALSWPIFIDSASFGLLPKNTVSTLALDERCLALRSAGVRLSKFPLSDAETCRKGGDFHVIHPDETFRSRAASAATRALEAQAILEPNIVHVIHLGHVDCSSRPLGISVVSLSSLMSGDNGGLRKPCAVVILRQFCSTVTVPTERPCFD